MRPCKNGPKDFRRQLAVNCVVGAIPAACLLLIDAGVGRGDLRRSVVIGMVFANSIAFPARFLIPRLYPSVARRGQVGEWTAVTLTLVAFAFLGCLAGTVVLALLGFFPWPA